MRTTRFSALVATLLAYTPALAESPLPTAAPDKVGMSRERLQQITTTFKGHIDKNEIPGAVIAVARKGQLVYFEALGHRDPATKAAMPADAIFSIASMTKPMVSIAIMQLHDEGKLFLADPVGKHIPELADRKVGVVKDGTLDTVAAVRQPTIQDLLRHTSGFTYGGRGETPVHKMWPASSAYSSVTFTGPEFVAALAKAPLLYQPGTQWDYSLSIDVLGLIVEKVSGKPLMTYLQERITGPLGMVDTSFAIPDAKKARYALAYPDDPRTGRPQSVLHAGKPLKFDCGGGCLVSTAPDYIRFAQMLVNGGVLGDKRIIAPRTLAMMTTDQLGPEVRARTTSPVLQAGYGFGLGFAVRNGIATTAGSIGDYNWGGAFGTYFWVDPKEQLTAVLMAATPGEIRSQTRDVLRNLVMQSIVD
jgi:CubicO group peptidase (beta-lactamase class C family)